MGILDGFQGLLGTSMEDPRTLATLQLAQGLLGPGGGMQRLVGGLQGYGGVMAQSRREEEEKRRRALQEQMLTQQLEAAKAAQAERDAERARRQAIEGAYRGAMRTPDQIAMAANGGPTRAAAAAALGMAPQLDQQALIRNLMQADPMSAAQMLTPEKPNFVNVDGALVQTNAQGGPRAVFERNKPPDMNQLIIPGPDGKPMINTLLADAKRGIARAGATNVSVNAGAREYDKALAGAAVNVLEKEREAATAASGVLQSVGEIRRAVQGGAYQGTGAELKLNVVKALGALGMPYDAKTVANTEVFSAQANQFVLNSIKQLGANPSNADREFIEKTVPRLQTDPAALPELLQFLEAKARRQIQSFNSRARSAQAGAGFIPFSLEVPEPASGNNVFDAADRIINGGR